MCPGPCRGHSPLTPHQPGSSSQSGELIITCTGIKAKSVFTTRKSVKKASLQNSHSSIFDPSKIFHYNIIIMSFLLKLNVVVIIL